MKSQARIEKVISEFEEKIESLVFYKDNLSMRIG